MRRDTALTFTSILITAGIILGPFIAEFRGQVRTPPITSTPETIQLRRVKDDSRRDFCSMRQGPGGACTAVDIRCPSGWQKICQGSCACGGTICQCVRDKKANEANACGNGVCEPGEYRTEKIACDPRGPDCLVPVRLIPICLQDCAALARSGTKESTCFDQAVHDCMRAHPQPDAATQKDCRVMAERLCGSDGTSPACTNVRLKQCMDRLMTRGTSGIDAERQCLADCNGMPVTPPPTPPVSPTPPPSVGGCSADEYGKCVERVIIQGTMLSDAQDQCKRICSGIQNADRTYLEQLKKRIAQCEFTTVGRCCEVAKQIGEGLESTCVASCSTKGIPMTDRLLCK